MKPLVTKIKIYDEQPYETDDCFKCYFHFRYYYFIYVR